MVAVCVLEICEAPADAGKWCRAHWDEQFARDVEIEMSSNDQKSAALRIVTLRRQLDFLAERTTREWCTCGHMLVVHSHGGCHGLSQTGGWNDWGPDYRACRCPRFEAS